ncbi:protein of unknown function [Paraburkholderia kururiensis]
MTAKSAWPHALFPMAWQGSAELQAMSSAQRATAILTLANLLIQAAGGAIGRERDDDERRSFASAASPAQGSSLCPAVVAGS